MSAMICPETPRPALVVMIRSAGRVVASLALATLLLGCANSTQLSTTWKAPGTKGPLAFKKVVVMALNTTPGDRRAEEDELVSQIHRSEAMPSYVLVPDIDLANREMVKNRMIEAGADGAVILRLIEARNESDYIPGTNSYWAGSSAAAAPGRYVTNRIIRAEVGLYSLPDGKLIWSGSSTTSNPDNAKDLAMQVARAGAVELKQQGLLQ
jgi:hypothetical protein